MNQNELMNTNEEMLKAIHQKLSSIEERVARTEFLLMEGKNILSTSVDSFDSILTNSSSNKKLESILLILKKISSEDSLDRIITLLDKVEKLVPIIENTDFISFFIDVLDDFCNNFKNSGVEISTVLNNILKILPSLTDSKTFELITKLLENKENLINLISMSEMLPAVLNTAVDTFDEYAQIIKNNPKVNILKDNFQDIKQDITISVNNTPNNVGILDILKLLNDPNIRKEIFIALSVVKSFGHKML